MSSRLEDLRDLAQLLDEGKVSPSEYEVIKTEILEASPEEWTYFPAPEGPVPPAEREGGHSITADQGLEIDASMPEASDGEPTGDVASKPQPDWIRFVRQTPAIYWAALGASLITIFYGGSFVPLAWATTAVGGAGLVSKKVKDGRWMAWAAVVLGVAFFMSDAYFSGDPAAAVSIPTTTSGPEVLPEIPVDSLGVRFGELAERWNALEKPPYVLTGISATPEPGALDAFTYRFDGGAVLAGAYNPSDGYIYALMVRASVLHEATASLYVHLCYLLYPGTQDCFDAYVDQSGIFGRGIEELAGSQHDSNWIFDDNEWRIEIADDVQTMRILGPTEASRQAAP